MINEIFRCKNCNFPVAKIQITCRSNTEIYIKKSSSLAIFADNYSNIARCSFCEKPLGIMQNKTHEIMLYKKFINE